MLVIVILDYKKGTCLALELHHLSVKLKMKNIIIETNMFAMPNPQTQALSIRIEAMLPSASVV